jgi:hypothetical protein
MVTTVPEVPCAVSSPLIVPPPEPPPSSTHVFVVGHPYRFDPAGAPELKNMLPALQSAGSDAPMGNGITKLAPEKLSFFVCLL